MIRAPHRHGDDVKHKRKSKVALLMVRYMRAFDAVDDEAKMLAGKWRAAAMEKAKKKKK